MTLGAVVLQPLTATPSYAGYNCGTILQAGDCTPPDTTITERPPAETESPDATFAFEAEDESAGDEATFECRLERGEEVVQDWTDCTDPTPSKPGYSTGSEAFAGLSVGSYTFSVRGTDTGDTAGGPANTETTPATYSWDVVEGEPPPDTDEPQTEITAGASRWHPFSYLGITYRSSEPARDFRCTLNGSARACDDDRVELYGMRAGDYRFTVAAVDEAGNVDPTPAKERWTVPLNNTVFGKHSREWDKRTGKGYFQDSYSITDQRGAFIEQGRRGFRSLVLVATRCPDCGTLQVFVKNELVRTVRLTATETRKRQIIPVASWRNRQSGQVRLVVTSQGRDVVVEGLGFSARR